MYIREYVVDKGEWQNWKQFRGKLYIVLYFLI